MIIQPIYSRPDHGLNCIRETETIQGLRFQIYASNDVVHVHDDGAGLRFECSKNKFKEEVGSAMKDLKKADGIAKIKGRKSVSLYLCSDGGNFNAFVIREGDSRKKEVEKFLRRL